MDKIKDFLSSKRNVIALVSAIVVVGIICVVVGSNSKNDKKTATSGNVKVEKETTLKIEKESTPVRERARRRQLRTRRRQPNKP